MSKTIIAVLHNIRSRENVGSMFRTADAAGVSKLYLCGITPSPSQILPGKTWEGKPPEHDKIAKTALGAEKWVAWKYHKQTGRLLEQLKKEGFQVIALEKTKKAKDLFSIETKTKVALVVGNEVVGLSPAILKQCDKVISIPMHGKKESLNVAVAFGIAVYQLSC